jgi:hypothetical protein
MHDVRNLFHRSSDIKEPYDVVLVMHDGSEKIYARYNRDGSSKAYQ